MRWRRHLSVPFIICTTHDTDGYPHQQQKLCFLPMLINKSFLVRLWLMSHIGRYNNITSVEVVGAIFKQPYCCLALCTAACAKRNEFIFYFCCTTQRLQSTRAVQQSIMPATISQLVQSVLN